MVNTDILKMKFFILEHYYYAKKGKSERASEYKHILIYRIIVHINIKI